MENLKERFRAREGKIMLFAVLERGRRCFDRDTV